MFPTDQQALIGTLVFFAIIVITGWLGVNESTRMEAFTAGYDARSIQRGAGLFATNCSSCHGAQGQGIEGVAPALNAQDLFDGTRLAELAYTGTVHDYVELTISAGRPKRTQDWPQPMPTWSQEYGGPLRPDQVRDLTNFVLNWGCQYDEDCIQEDDVAALGEPPPPGAVAATEEAPAYEAVCDEAVTECTPLEELPAGDAANGEALFTNTQPAPDGGVLGCAGCHSLDGSVLVGPSQQGFSERVPAEYASPEEYAYTSILHPSEYIREGFPDAMPKNFGVRLDAQSLADLIAFVSSQ